MVLGHPAASQFAVDWMLVAMETAEWMRASVVVREPGNSTERELPSRSKVRLLSVFVAFSVAARITVRPKTFKVLSSTSLDRSRPD